MDQKYVEVDITKRPFVLLNPKHEQIVGKLETDDLARTLPYWLSDLLSGGNDENRESPAHSESSLEEGQIRHYMCIYVEDGEAQNKLKKVRVNTNSTDELCKHLNPNKNDFNTTQKTR